jgi:hypothetical protein
MLDRPKVFSLMWSTKAGCVGLDEEVCSNHVWRICDLLDQDARDAAYKVGLEAECARMKAQVPESFRRAFVKALVETELQEARKEIRSSILILVFVIAALFVVFTETGRSILPSAPKAWASATWLRWVMIIGSLMAAGDIWSNCLTIRDSANRESYLQKFLL